MDNILSSIIIERERMKKKLKIVERKARDVLQKRTEHLPLHYINTDFQNKK